MNISSVNTRNIFSFFKESQLSNVNPLQKRILLVAALALGLLTASYFISRYYFKAKILSDEKDNMSEGMNSPLSQSSPQKLDEENFEISKKKTPSDERDNMSEGMNPPISQSSPQKLDEENFEISKKKTPSDEKDNRNEGMKKTPISQSPPQKLDEENAQISEDEISDQDNFSTEFYFNQNINTPVVKSALKTSKFKTPGTKKISFDFPSPGNLLPSAEKSKVKTPKCEKITGKLDGIQTLPEDLDELVLASCVALTDDDILKLPRNLKKLSITGSKKLTNEAIKNLPRTLLDFSLANSAQITNDAMSDLPPGLTKLSLRGMDLNNDGIKLLSETLPKLTDLSLTGFPVNDDMIGFLSHIKKLSITRCEITDAAFGKLPKNLEEFTLVDCPFVNDAGFKDLPINLKKLSLTGYTLSDDVRKLFIEATITVDSTTPSKRY